MCQFDCFSAERQEFNFKKEQDFFFKKESCLNKTSVDIENDTGFSKAEKNMSTFQNYKKGTRFETFVGKIFQFAKVEQVLLNVKSKVSSSYQ